MSVLCWMFQCIKDEPNLFTNIVIYDSWMRKKELLYFIFRILIYYILLKNTNKVVVVGLFALLGRIASCHVVAQ